MRNALILALIISSLAFAQAEKKQGIAVLYTAGGKTDAVTSRLAALYVPKGSPATPFLPVGPFKAVFRADIASQLRSEYTFAVEVRGQVKVSVNGAEILDAAGAAAAQYADKTVQLRKGANAVVIEFANDGDEDALLRFDWWSSEFPREPVPPTAWSHTPDSESAKVHEGRMLFATRHCAACHDAGAAIAKDGTGMPELLSTAPSLMDAGARFQAPWLAAWAEAPRSIRPNAMMPHLPITKAQAADIAAYLATTGKPVKEDELPVDDALLGKGAALFGNLGCVACHTTPDATEPDKEHGRIPLAHVSAKFFRAALREFLKMPGMHNPWTRMPNFRLTDDETREISAYLLTNAKAQFPPQKGDAANGKKLVAANCASCHQTPAGASPAKAATLAAVISAGAKGCLAEKPEKAPDFGFTGGQREAVLVFLKTDLLSLKQDTFSDFAERQIRHNNCTACHPRDGHQSTFQMVEGELAALTANAPQPEGQTEGNTVPATAIPHLTWLGEKLQPGWAGGFIVGVAPYKPRPWLASRMPGFGAPGIGIANGLSFQHGLPLSDIPTADKTLGEHGQKLLGADGGFNCIQCHGVKDIAPTAVFEAPGINLAYTTERLRKGFFRRWLLAPLRIDAETKMPKFSEDGVSTQITDVLDGKAAQQFDAIWQYLQTVK